MRKLAIITTHPIQYYAPIFKLLAQRSVIDVKVFYTWGKASQQKFDPGFGKTVDWDLPLLESYQFEWADNTSPQPGSHHFKGIITPNLCIQINAFKPDAILVIGWAYQSHLSAMRYFYGKVPVYFRGDSTLLDKKRGLKNILKYAALKWVYKNVDHVFYPGNNSKAYFKKFGFKELQLSFAPHAVDNERFAASRIGEANAFRLQLGIAANQKVVLFAGKLEEKKDPTLLLQAFKLVNNANAHLVFLGNGHLEPALKSTAGEMGNIHFVDFVNQTGMPLIYQACNVFCLPSKGPGETWGLAVNEAMACGKAILVSDKVGCAPDLVKPGYNGEIFKSGNLQEFTEKLSEMLSPAVDLNKYGLNSAAIIKDWNFSRIAETIELKLLNEKV